MRRRLGGMQGWMHRQRRLRRLRRRVRLGLRIQHGPLPLTTVIVSAADISAAAGPWAASVHASGGVGPDFTIAGVVDSRSSRVTFSARQLRSREVMTYFNVQRDEQTRASHRHSSPWSPRPLTVVVLATLLFVVPVRDVEVANAAGGHGGGAAGGFAGGRGGRPGGGFRGHDFERRRFHHFDDGLGLYIFPGSPYYDYEPYEPYVYDPYCNEDSPSYDSRYCDASP